MEVDEEVRLGDIINVGSYKVFNLFVIQPFQHIETSDIEWLK